MRARTAVQVAGLGLVAAGLWVAAGFPAVMILLGAVVVAAVETRSGP